MSISLFHKKKQSGEKISMITCYDYSSACLLAETNVDCLLVGDSVAMTMHGFANTLAADIHMMQLHTAAVSRGAANKFIVSDLPFLSYRKSLDESVDAVLNLMQAGANAVKLEGASGNLELARHLVDSGVPVMGHLGLTPQLVSVLGGYKVQGKTIAAANRIIADAHALQQAGCFAIVLECVPSALAEQITKELTIATIGIGAGNGTNGQVLVWQDLLGLNQKFTPKFVKQFVNGSQLLQAGINQFIQEVQSGEFPKHEHSY